MLCVCVCVSVSRTASVPAVFVRLWPLAGRELLLCLGVDQLAEDFSEVQRPLQGRVRVPRYFAAVVSLHFLFEMSVLC